MLFIRKIKNLEYVQGGKVTNAFSKIAKTCKVVTKHSTIEGSLTQPTFVLRHEKINIKAKNVFSWDDLELVELSSLREKVRRMVLPR